MQTSSVYTIVHEDSSSKARTGLLTLPHGIVHTPVFMPVGTNGTVKALTKEDLTEIGFEIILSNTYHLYLRPGPEVIEQAGGLHQFIQWERNILTDSGGYQVFSLAPFRKISELGVKFRSHIDGSYHLLTPERVVELQAILGSDIQMQLDVCTSWGTEYTEARRALHITDLWLQRALKAWKEIREKTSYEGLLFAIVQGNFYHDLRKLSAEKVVASDTPGIAIGGLSVGEPFPVFQEFLAATAEMLPREKPRYVMGIGTPRYILEAIEQGIDMFDCVFPTRTARNGLLFTASGPISIKREQYERDFSPLDPQCTCKVCRAYSRSYLRHLYKTKEILYAMLASYHNLFFLQNLVGEARKAIEEDRFIPFKKEFLSQYERADAETP
ncbi:MAG TPA: tRNA guanosine(34) transglycosylase Tgt [Termitinemataceae bacterium]|nr:tRNA guanosine(34) transglycosylase Tgt [Termitinemataceae bacterium]HOM22397.1 tRNA guanosine(34) transglycosylase Tgt [Termitinemataceae bacterium]HPP99603.1 tRNA guanosine(34) transglycosylase Tgt [Termitinemataceae bacterium]